MADDSALGCALFVPIQVEKIVIRCWNAFAFGLLKFDFSQKRWVDSLEVAVEEDFWRSIAGHAGFWQSVGWLQVFKLQVTNSLQLVTCNGYSDFSLPLHSFFKRGNMSEMMFPVPGIHPDEVVKAYGFFCVRVYELSIEFFVRQTFEQGGPFGVQGFQ